MRFLFMHSSILCIVAYATKKIYAYTSLCDLYLTHIIHIVNLAHKFVALRYNRVLRDDNLQIF